jgi:hypothetical protein
MLLRVCIENRTHKKPRIMGWTICDDIDGITHGVCEQCVGVIREEIRRFKTERDQSNLQQQRL